MSGIELIAKERQEHFDKHFIFPDNDVEDNGSGQLMEGAKALLFKQDETITENDIHTLRPKEGNHGMGWKHKIFHTMMRNSYKERLIIAGALLCAELDRLDELEALAEVQ